MDRIAAGLSGTRPKSSPDLEGDVAPQGGSLFGINWARLVKTPLVRWKASLAILALSTVVAIGYARTFSSSYYDLSGTLTHRPQPEQKDSPAPRTIETFLDEMKSPQY